MFIDFNIGDENKQHLCYIHFNVKKGKKATQKQQEKIWVFYGEGTGNNQTYQKWFANFHAHRIMPHYHFC